MLEYTALSINYHSASASNGVNEKTIYKHFNLINSHSHVTPGPSCMKSG